MTALGWLPFVLLLWVSCSTKAEVDNYLGAIHSNAAAALNAASEARDYAERAAR